MPSIMLLFSYSPQSPAVFETIPWERFAGHLATSHRGHLETILMRKGEVPTSNEEVRRGGAATSETVLPAGWLQVMR